MGAGIASQGNTVYPWSRTPCNLPPLKVLARAGFYLEPLPFVQLTNPNSSYQFELRHHLVLKPSLHAMLLSLFSIHPVLTSVKGCGRLITKKCPQPSTSLCIHALCHITLQSHWGWYLFPLTLEQGLAL